MPDIATIGTALTSIKTAAEIAKLISGSDKTLEQAEFKMKIADLVGALADAKMQIAKIQETIIQKDHEILSLTKKLELNDSMVWDEPYYWRDINGIKEGPFCQQCFDGNNKLVRLISNGYQQGVWVCNTCKTTVTDCSYSDKY